jgi:hypothetical protein
LYVIALVDRIVRSEDVSVPRAARLVVERYGREVAKEPRSVEKEYSQFKALYYAYRTGQYVPGAELAPARWIRKE